MKRVALFLIRLYPADWRARYGEEFETLLEDSPAGFSSLFDLLKGAIKMQLSAPSFPKLALLLSLAGLVVGFGISFLLTPQYVSEAVMTYEGTSNAADVNPSLREHFFAVQNEVLSRTSLSFLIRDPRLDLYREERRKMPLEDVIDRMRRQDVKIRALELPGVANRNYEAFEISYSYRDPRKAQQTVRTLVYRFMESNVARQERDRAVSPPRHSSDQVSQMEARIAVLEKRLGIAPGQSASGEARTVAPRAINLNVVDSPSLPQLPSYPDRSKVSAMGFASGFVLAAVIAIFRRRPGPIPFPAATA